MEPEPSWESVPWWLRVLSSNRFVRARAEARRREIGPQHCDRCGQLLGEKMYLLVKTRWLFWTQSQTRLCPQCQAQHMEQLRQAGVLPPGL
jgi:hypothetical protein